MTFQKLVRRLKRRLGIQSNVNTPFAIYDYKNESGQFDYKEYVNTQTSGNKQKIEQSWITKSDVEFISTIVKRHTPRPTFGICHGTRQGLEQKWFADALGCKVIGTEISDTATQFANTVQWDFHETKAEWHHTADFVYSNSLDHAYDPQKALRAWVDTLTDNGVCILEHTQNHQPSAVSKLDPFGVQLEYFPYLVLNWLDNGYSVREIIKSPQHKEAIGHPYYLVIKRNF